jgi:eukaryotic-like serine/threonine-protein kinase
MAGETLLNNRYELVAQQGSGGMSVIYKATDRSLERTVAIKILRPSLTQDPAFLGKFQQEARSVAKMKHPNIVTVHDVGSDGPTHYIVMEMVDGNDLKKVIKTQGALPFQKALNYAISICNGLGYAHRSRLVHADVKPQNILINQDDVVKITDFGIAQAYTDTMPQARAEVVWGSPHYFAPEQARGEKPSPASDVYSIGIVMFEMFTGRLPFVGASQRELAMAHIQAEIPRAKDVNPAVPEEISNIIAKIMSKRPNDRFSQGDQLGHILKGIQDRTRQNGPSEIPGRIAPPTIESVRPVANPPRKAPSRQAPPPPPVSTEDTYRHSAAPDAPSYKPAGKSTIAPPNPFVDNTVRRASDSRPISPVPPNQFIRPDGRGNPRELGGYTGPIRSVDERQQEGLDFVTITLVFFALIAVVGLVLLYLFGVFPALAN